MNPNSSTFDLQGNVLRIVPEVFETMLSLAVSPITMGRPTNGERVSGSISIEGEMLSGTVYLHLTEMLARRATVAMLGLDSPDAADTSSVNDVVSELANMVGGGFKSALCNANLPCAMSTPSIVRGTNFAIERSPGLRSEVFSFDCHGELLAVEVHFKLNSPRPMPTKILSVDDSKTIRMIIKRIFSPYDVTVFEACNGQEGLDVATASMPDLIILDITMPVMDGVTLLTTLKTIPELKGIPVIMLTAESGRENVAFIAKLGVRDFLVKPFKDEQLIEKVIRVIPLQKKTA